MIKTKYPLFEYWYLLGIVPWDFHALNLPYHLHFDSLDWEEGAGYIAKNRGNGTRFFLATGEKEGDLENYHLPFLKKNNGKFDLTKFGNGMTEIEWRLEKFWERVIATMICIATSIKGPRFKHSVWHKRNNVNGTTDDHKRFMGHEKTKEIYKKVLKNLWLRWKDKPVIFELINEPHAFTDHQKYEWYQEMMDYCKSLGIPPHQFAFEKWDSGKCWLLLKKYDCWMFVHAMNSLKHMKRVHKASMQREYFESFRFVASNSDGADPEFPGTGLVGKTWGEVLKKPAPQDMKEGLKKDYKKQGAGWFIGSAAAYYKNPEGDRPNYVHWKNVALNGLTKDECRQQNVDWRLFSYRKLFKRKPLGELKAIRKAAKKIFE